MGELVLYVVAAVVIGAVVVAIVMRVLYVGFDNLLDWLILTFGNESAAERIRNERLERDG